MSSADRVVNSIGIGVFGYVVWTIADLLGGRMIALGAVTCATIIGLAVLVWREDLKREWRGFYDRHD